MRCRSLRILRWGLTTVMLVVLLAAPVQAQDEDKGPFKEPGIRYMEQRKPYIQWLAGALIIVACLFVGAKNPHRTHLD